jgi:hypothetical protein
VIDSAALARRLAAAIAIPISQRSAEALFRQISKPALENS